MKSSLMQRFFGRKHHVQRPQRGRRPRALRRFESLEDRRLLAVTASFSAQFGQLTVIGDQQDNVINISRADNGDILINNGEVAVTGGTPTVQNTSTILALGLDGNDQITLNEFNGALPNAFLFGSSGNDVLIGGSGQDYLSGSSGNDFIRGGDNNDQIFGGSGNDVLLGDRGNDEVQGQEGSDLLIWNDGDGSDFLEGGAGNDTVQVNGSNTDGDVILISPNGSRVRLERTNLDLFPLDVGTTETIDINTLGGNDRVTGSTGLAALTSLDIDGGIGTDVLTGGDGNDRIAGGADTDLLLGRDGNDVLIGNQGNDFVFGENGNDLIVHNEGDGNDLIEGGLGRDTIQINTGNLDDEIYIDNRDRVLTIDRVFEEMHLNIGGAEVLDLRTGDGNDEVVVNDLTGVQDLETITVDLGDGDDVINAMNLQAGVALNARGGEGNDILFGGFGNDVLLGEEGRDIIIAGDGNDFISGGDDNDILISGNGNDVLLGGDDDDVLSGGRGDILLAGNGDDMLNSRADVVGKRIQTQ